MSGPSSGAGWVFYTSGGFDDTDALLEVHAGVKAFVSDDAALSLDARYEAATEYMDRGVLGFYAGFSVFF